jgi:predicted metal-dependent phosphoesterase TrpH
MRCDLHVHSKHSGPVDLPLLRHLGRESYSEPLDVYWTALRRGMDLVTLSDHDTIEGALQIAHLPHVFISEEVTCALPGGRELHLGVWDIDERQHARLQEVCDDAEALFAHLAEEALPFGVNHPFSPLTGRREVADLHLAFERAPAVEVLNGMMPRASNDCARAAARVAGLAGVGGSDAHAMAAVARAFTEVPGARTREEFLEGLRQGRTLARGRSGSYARLAADIVAVFTGAVGENLGLAGRSLADLGRFAGVAALLPALILVPGFALFSYARERVMADVHHRRYRTSLTERWPQRQILRSLATTGPLRMTS